MICLRILDWSVQVTKSSRLRLTRKAGSVTVSGPTRTWPCSISVTASFSVSDIFNLAITTGSLRLQNAEAGMVAHNDNDFFPLMRPMSKSFSINNSVVLMRNGSRASKFFKRLTSFLILPQSLLYLEIQLKTVDFRLQVQSTERTRYIRHGPGFDKFALPSLVEENHHSSTERSLPSSTTSSHDALTASW